MSKVLTPQKAMLSKKIENEATPTAGENTSAASSPSSVVIDFDDFTTSSSILEFLSKEQECCSEADAESIFQEVSRLADNSDTRSVDEILREAELLIQQQTLLGAGGKGASVSSRALKSKQPQQSIKISTKCTKRIESSSTQTVLANKSLNGHCSTNSSNHSLIDGVIATPTPTSQTPTKQFTAFVDNLPSESVISEESTPNLDNCLTVTERDATLAQLNDDTENDDTDTMEEITEGIETIEILVNEGPCALGVDGNGRNFDAHSSETINVYNTTTSISSITLSGMSNSARTQHTYKKNDNFAAFGRRPSCEAALQHSFASQPQAQLVSPTRRAPLNFNATQACSPSPMEQRRNSGGGGVGGVRRSSMTTPDSGIGHSAQTPRAPYSPHKTPATASAFCTQTPLKTYCDKSVNSSPKHLVSSLTSPIEPAVMAITREHALKQDIDLLQEKLKDTEERLQSLRIQHDSLSQLHRDLRENNTHIQEQSELLKLDVQHLNECANILRTELQSARTDRNEALDLQKSLQIELEESRNDRKRTQDQKEKDTKTIQDLQRQCREMERILMRKHPDSVSALIVASKNPGNCSLNDQENLNSRKLLEQRIAQLEADAKEQDLKAQKILANVQARFNSVQSKYETHIADLETQVLSLQEINTKLNEKIESQVRTLDYFVTKKAEKYYNNCTQTNIQTSSSTGTQTPPKTSTAAIATRDHSTNTIGSSASRQPSASSSTSSTANSTPNTSRPNSKQSGLRKPSATAAGSLTSMLSSKLPVSHSDSTIALTAYHAAAKEDAHLLATIRGMRVDLAVKDKAMQRLTRELDECKKTIRKLQKEKDACKAENSKPNSWFCSASSSRRSHSDMDHTPANTESQALREAQSKIKLLEADYKSLHDKRLQDLKTLQTAHERELASCHETVRILQQRLNERDEAFSMQKRRKVPVDYYALKAKVSSLERRHSEREERLHMLVEALSKGRLNGALEDLLGDNNNQ